MLSARTRDDITRQESSGRAGMPAGRPALLAAMTAGVAVLIAAVVAGVAAGGVWRLRNGRMRRVLARSPGRTAGPAEPGAEAPALTAAELGRPLGERATLVQFSSAFCAPCRATRRILTEVAGLVDGVTHIEIDAESRLDLVRQLSVLRTPTVLVLAADGRIVRRASGQPRKPDVIAAIGAAAGV